MREQASRLGWNFPYLLDDTQEVARAYDAACTPDFFLFDGEMKLVYRGQLDDSRPRRGDSGNDTPVTGKDLRAALDAVVAGKRPDTNQRTSLGCNIKWREANSSHMDPVLDTTEGRSAPVPLGRVPGARPDVRPCRHRNPAPSHSFHCLCRLPRRS